MIFSINRLIIWSKKCLDFGCFLKVTSSDVSFCPTNSPKLKDTQFVVVEDEKNQQTFTFGTKTEAVAG